MEDRENIDEQLILDIAFLDALRERFLYEINLILIWAQAPAN